MAVAYRSTGNGGTAYAIAMGNGGVGPARDCAGSARPAGDSGTGERRNSGDSSSGSSRGHGGNFVFPRSSREGLAMSRIAKLNKSITRSTVGRVCTHRKCIFGAGSVRGCCRDRD